MDNFRGTFWVIAMKIQLVAVIKLSSLNLSKKKRNFERKDNGYNFPIISQSGFEEFHVSELPL